MDVFGCLFKKMNQRFLHDNKMSYPMTWNIITNIIFYILPLILANISEIVTDVLFIKHI